MTSGWRAGVEFDPLRKGVTVRLGRQIGDDMHVVSAVDWTGATMHALQPHEHAPLEAALSLPEDAARALLDALAEHFGLTSSGRALRADFEHERARGDRLTDAMVQRLLLDGEAAARQDAAARVERVEQAGQLSRVLSSVLGQVRDRA